MHATPPWPTVDAPPGWQTVDCIADVHLSESDPQTFAQWEHYLQTTTADALFLLGDVFEVWVGDDVLDAPHAQAVWERRCQAVLQAASCKAALFFLPGNRDFLLGTRFAQACGFQWLADPTILVFGGQRWLLSHGDALCQGDVEYQRFRNEVRSPAWMEQFLSLSLQERRTTARTLRAASSAQRKPDADVDDALVLEWLQAAGAHTLIHGHTHRPREHRLGDGYARFVLGDWNASSTPVRGDVLRLSLHSPPQRLAL
ncbi:UDP-2,3-diacylglucosamine diphosphatase [Candidatus Symbiobacter mobilis]|uniref:UDP-2,3-diacylglucosamine hydrolase n=1 Tax=Candidatus Symbiobacter mobilis CR TaxID=946483 RepID=U5N5D8_9BURK|nr:UDP-2,3-diacylglucosamine diphosphatase [Candidatus Symbiobacter mobilis]AGX86731.1 UDP-2,3-diacylglucosamine hydrolase [Candidatus Symbiobacter mobilis CR]